MNYNNYIINIIIIIKIINNITIQLTIISCEYVNRNTPSTRCLPVSSTVPPPNITLLLSGSVWRVNAPHGGGRVPVMTGTIH